MAIRFSVGDYTITQSSLWQVRINGTDRNFRFPPGTLLQTNVAANGPQTGNISFSSQEAISGPLLNRGICLGERSGQPVQLTSGPMTFSSPLPSKDGKKLFVVGALARC